MKIPLEVQVAARKEWRSRRGYRARREAERARKRQERSEAKARLIIHLTLRALGCSRAGTPTQLPRGWRHPPGFRAWT